MHKDIISDLSAKGILYHGKPFAVNTIYNILHLKKYTGICTYSGEIYTNIFPQIIPTALFESVEKILAKNKIGSKSRETDFLLKKKIICGYCGKYLQGDSGTSKSRNKYYYYKCMGRKKLDICQKNILPKEAFEETVIKATMRVFGSEKGISDIADRIMELHVKRMYDNSILTLLVSERDSLKRALANIMKAIEQGIMNATTKARMDELEIRLSEMEEKILQEEYKEKKQITKEQIVEYLSQTIRQEPKLLINNLIQKIIVYDDRFEVYYNYLKHMPKVDDPYDFNRIIFLLSVRRAQFLSTIIKNTILCFLFSWNILGTKSQKAATVNTVAAFCAFPDFVSLLLNLWHFNIYRSVCIDAK